MGELLQCPACKLISSPAALRCDCGHRFRGDQTPLSACDDAYTQPLAPPSLPQMLFSLEGRIGRLQYWGHVLATLVGFVFVTCGIALCDVERNGSPLAGVLTLVALLLMCWIMLALKVKRLHDRDRPGWWLLLSGFPLMNLWVAIEIGLLAGTPGRNQYGPPPE
jgi:uncharacterized membrane protein YhaH (DUF805 family)